MFETAGTSAGSNKGDNVMSREGTMTPFVKDEFPLLFVKEEPRASIEHTILKVNHEKLRKEHGFLVEKLDFEISEKIRVEKEMKELQDQFLRLKGELILLGDENSRGRLQREEQQKMLKEMKAKEREYKNTISELTLELEKWRSRFSELDAMVLDVAKDCLEVRSMYIGEMNGGVWSGLGVVRPRNAGTGVPRTENACQGGVINISDSDEEENIQGDRQDRNRSKSLERSQKDGKRLRISPDINRDSVSSGKTGEGGGERRISIPGVTPRPYSPPSSSSMDTSSSDADAGVPNFDAHTKFRHDKLQLKRS